MGTAKKKVRKYSTGTYHVVGSAVRKKKSSALKEAKRYRSLKIPARVEHVKGGYKVFVRYKK